MLADLIVGTWFLRKDRTYFLPILAAFASAAYQGYQASKQRAAASKLRPSNYITPAVQEAEANTRQQVYAPESPGYNRGLQQLNRSTSNYINAAQRLGGSPVQLQQGVADADARQKELVKDLEINNEQFRAQRRQDLNSLLMQKGQYQQKSMDDYNAAVSALKGAASQNEFNAISNTAEGLINTAPVKEPLKDGEWQQMTGGQKVKKAVNSIFGINPSIGGYGRAYGNSGGTGSGGGGYYNPAGAGLSRFNNMNLSPYERELLTGPRFNNMNLTPYEKQILSQQGLY